jgi:hypothetical protein
VFLRVAARAAVLAVAIAGALLAGNALRAVRTDAPLATPDPGSAAGSAGSASATSAANCIMLGQVAPKIATPIAVQDLANGTQRVTSAEGGYSVVLPSAWFATANAIGITPQFGQLHATSYDPKTAPTPDPERWMLPPQVGISVDVQVWLNPDHEPLDLYAEHILIGPDQIARQPGTMTSIDGQAVYRFVINDEHRFQPADRPLVVTKQTRVVWIVQSGNRDRVIVAYATPGESALFAATERAISRMTITTPLISQRPVVLQRDEVLRQWLYDKNGAFISGRRAEAKLMTFTEANAAMTVGGGPPPSSGGPKPIQLLRLDHDPDDLYWVIAVSGPDLPQGRGGPLGLGAPAGTPPPTTWILGDMSATGNNTGPTAGQYSTQGSWPQNFDALLDRCR